MTLTINDTTMTGDQTAHTARQAASREHHWEVSWLPGRVLDRNGAITAKVLADQADVHDLNERHRLWPHIEGWGAELGLTGQDAVNRIFQVRSVSSAAGNVNGLTPRRDNDRPAP